MLNIEKEKMNIPEFLIPLIDRFYEPLEMDLLQILRNKPLEKKNVIKLLIKNKGLKLSTILISFWKESEKEVLSKFLTTEGLHWKISISGLNIGRYLKDGRIFPLELRTS